MRYITKNNSKVKGKKSKIPSLESAKGGEGGGMGSIWRISWKLVLRWFTSVI
jgi:hypothetical protein